MTILPTGTQYSIRCNDTSAVVAEVGATLRSLRVEGREFLWTYGDDELPVQWVGTTLAPWPNRIRDGVYTFDGEAHRLPINEHALGTALHGLAHALEWRLVDRASDRVSLATTIYPQPGWAGVLHIAQTVSVADESLTVEWEARNRGTTSLPFGYGSHPYFVFDSLEEVSLSSPFARELLVDDRLLPLEVAEVSGSHDFRQPHPLGDVTLDTAFTAAPTQWEVRLRADDRTVTVWGDEHHPWLQLYTHPNRRALAVEPMTCGPDAFNEGPTHAEVMVLKPGESCGGRWGVRVHA